MPIYMYMQWHRKQFLNGGEALVFEWKKTEKPYSASLDLSYLIA